MNEKQLLAMRKKLFLYHLLAKVFESESDFSKNLEKIQEEKKKTDPFAEIPIETIPETKQGSVKFNSSGVERFSALKNKLQSLNNDNGEVNAETERE